MKNFLAHKPRPKTDFRLEELDGEMLLYHPNRTQIMYCNPSASLIWQLCDGQRSVAEIIALLCAAYEHDEAVIAADVTATLDLFCKHGAIEYLDEAGQPVAAAGGG
jgi:hypothetical protein